MFSRAQRSAPNRLFLSESHFLCSVEDLFDVSSLSDQDKLKVDMRIRVIFCLKSV